MANGESTPFAIGFFARFANYLEVDEFIGTETVHPLPSHYNKNKHSFRGFIYASDTMLILYQKRTQTENGFAIRSIVAPLRLPRNLLVLKGSSNGENMKNHPSGQK